MSPTIFSCVLCGYVILDFEHPGSQSWLEQFRALYSSPTGTWISGVGMYNDPHGGTLIVPSDYAVRWDDVGYDFPARDELAVMQRCPNNGRHGFVFHEACWSLLEKVYHPEAVPLARLVEICKSLPFPLRGTGVCWGHDYGGLVLLDSQNHYPWEDQLIERDENSIQCQHARANPYDVPEIQQLLQEPAQIPPSRKETSSSGPIIGKGNYFISLPWEILEAVAIYLPTVDVLNLRLGSRAFADIFSSQRFWASRFGPNADRGFLFEKRNNKDPRDWRSLYRCTNNAHNPPGLRNRKRIWNLIQSLTDILSLRWNDSLDLSRCEPNQADLRWQDITGDLRQEKSAGFHEGCSIFNKQCASIPDFLSQLAFSVIRVGNANYVTGIRFISRKGADVCFGYRAEGKELFLNVTAFRGFILAVGSRGIQALQVITAEGETSKWFGRPDESPRTQRLAHLGSIAALEAGFDGYKMVSLGVAEISSSHIKMPMGQSESLRDTALWYPEIPEPGLYLNEDCFTGEDPSTVGYRPLCWTLFGGSGGIYLRCLTEISATCLGSLCGIEFHYNTDEVPSRWRRLGLRKSTEYSHVMRFPVDGPGGEIIKKVEVGLESPHSKYANSCKHGKWRSFKISTNRARSFHFQPAQDSPDVPPLKPLVIAPGTTLTGFYASQHPEKGLVSFGVISEVI